jgi:hypothetical protein
LIIIQLIEFYIASKPIYKREILVKKINLFLVAIVNLFLVAIVNLILVVIVNIILKIIKKKKIYLFFYDRMSYITMHVPF